MTVFNQQLSANQVFIGNLGTIRWYFGSFKQTSAGMFRAVSRTVSKFITQKQGLI